MIRKLLAAFALLVCAPAFGTPAPVSAPTATKTNVATTDPTVSDDGSKGYVAGSVWTNTATQTRWFLNDASVGAAKWTPQANRTSIQPPYVSGRWYIPPNVGTTVSVTETANLLRLTPFVLAQPITVSAVGIRVSTAASGGNIGVAIYAADGSTFNPTGTPVLSANGLSTTSASTVSATLATAVALLPGRVYWMGINADNATAQLTGINTNTGVNMASLIGGSTLGTTFVGSTSGVTVSYQLSQTYGTWPDLTSATLTTGGNSTSPILAFQAQ